MATPTPHSIVWTLVRRQHGVISRVQLLGFGFGTSAIRHRIRTGRLHPIYRGVYAVGRPELSDLGRWMAAHLACGTSSFLSHFSAAALWGLRREGTVIELSVTGGDRRRLPGVIVHRRRGIQPVTHHGVPVTTVVDTLIDVAPSLTRFQLEAAIREADKRDLVDPERLREALGRTTARPGVGILKATLDRRTFRLTDSDLERHYLPLSDRAGLPRPLTQQWIDNRRVDFYYPDLELIVETDGLRYHRTPSQQAEDILRAQQHLASGFTPLRFTHEQVRYEPEFVVRTLRQTAARLGYRPAP